ncbi:GldG family protein [Candidatus Latescibacterota bacterium]
MQGKTTNITQVMIEKFFKFGLSPVIFAIALVVGLFIFNYIIAVKTPLFDVTKNKLNTLSKETINLLNDIDFEVNIKAFYTNSAYQERIRILFEKYKKENKNINVEFIDQIKNPLIAEKYDVSFPRTIVFESESKNSLLNPPPPGQYHTERNLTIALYRLLTEQTKTIYFSTGHGELQINNSDRMGLSTIRDRLIEQNYLVKTVNILDEGKVPDDCTLLIVAGQTVPFTDDEAEMIDKYLNSEGRIFLMVNPGKETNLENILTKYNLEYGNDYIYETSSRMTTDMGGPISPLCEAQNEHEITDNLPNQTFIFPFVRSIDVAQRSMTKCTRLLASSEDSWAETDIESAKTVETNIKPTRDEHEKKGPLTIAMATERNFLLPDSLKTDEDQFFFIRSSFWGNSMFITNSIVTPFPSNLNLFLNTVNWITRNEKIIEVTPNLAIFTPVNLNQQERRKLTWFTLILYPSFILFIGIVVWYRRR